MTDDKVGNETRPSIRGESIFGVPIEGSGDTYLDLLDLNDPINEDNVNEFAEYCLARPLGKNLFSGADVICGGFLDNNIISAEIHIDGKVYKCLLETGEMIQIGNTKPRWRLIRKMRRMS